MHPGEGPLCMLVLCKAWWEMPWKAKGDAAFLQGAWPWGGQVCGSPGVHRERWPTESPWALGAYSQCGDQGRLPGGGAI